MRPYLKKYSFVFPLLVISLLFVTHFVTSDELYNGIIVVIGLMFLGMVALVLLYIAFFLLLKKVLLRIVFNLPDILLLAFYLMGNLKKHSAIMGFRMISLMVLFKPKNVLSWKINLRYEKTL